MKIIDMNKTVYELAKAYPEIINIMAELGFTEITKKPVLNSVGKIMTINKGSKMKEIPMEKIIAAFEANGFEVTGAELEEEAKQSEDYEKQVARNTKESELDEDERQKLLKSYLRRLFDGEDLEKVKAEFVENFTDVDASEIMKAEQALIAEGTPITEVQRLCDLHSALFHGATREEKIANAEKAALEAAKRLNQNTEKKGEYLNKVEVAAKFVGVEGHPINTFTRENEELSKIIDEIEVDVSGTRTEELFTKLRDVSIHYAKKGDLIYPLLKVKYEIYGPNDIMWTVDDEIRDELAELAGAERNEIWSVRFKAVVKRIDEMIFKEANILFPICAVNFTSEEWYGIYEDSKDYDNSFGIEPFDWSEAEKAKEGKVDGAKLDSGEVVMSGGHMTVEQLTAMLNTIPIEITFVDADNINRFFNEGPKVFKRPGMAIDREVFSCHPPKVEPMVRQIIDDFRNGRRDIVPVWMNKSGRVMLVQYMAVRDKTGRYLGTLEAVQDMEFAREHFENN